MPTARTVTNWLRRSTPATLRPLIQLNQELVLESLARLDVPRLTLDVDGTVVRTGATVAWAFRGFNPHHRKDLSYYPLVAHVAQTGHILRLKNRPGNVHDSKQSAAFLRELIEAVRARLGRSLPLEFRMDAAFFQRDVLRLLAARRCAYAIKVGYWSWLPLKQLAAERRQWHALAPDVTGFEHQLVIPPWNLRLRVMIYRKHVQHESPKNFQLDLFTPDDGHFEYYAVATNLALSLPALYDFIGGRGAQEKTFAELKGEFGEGLLLSAAAADEVIQGGQGERQVGGDGVVLEVPVIRGEQIELEILGALVLDMLAVDHHAQPEVPWRDDELVLESRHVRRQRVPLPPLGRELFEGQPAPVADLDGVGAAAGREQPQHVALEKRGVHSEFQGQGPAQAGPHGFDQLPQERGRLLGVVHVARAVLESQDVAGLRDVGHQGVVAEILPMVRIEEIGRA